MEKIVFEILLDKCCLKVKNGWGLLKDFFKGLEKWFIIWVENIEVSNYSKWM